MASLADNGDSPAVVKDHRARLTYSEDLAAGIKHLLDVGAPFGTYNLTNEGEPQSWADVAADVFELSGRPRGSVTGVSTAEYFRGKEAAPRPSNSVLDLTKITGTGFRPELAETRLKGYLQNSK